MLGSPEYGEVVRSTVEVVRPKAKVSYSFGSRWNIPGSGGSGPVSLAQFGDTSRRRKRLTVTVRERTGTRILPPFRRGTAPTCQILLIQRLADQVLITACRLTFNSLAAVSNSSSMPDARSTFTLCIGPIMRPLLVKNRDTSLPSSARRAIAPADNGFRRLRVFSIKLLLLLGGLPKSQGGSTLLLCPPARK